MAEKLGFIGLGQMGAPMARNLARAGFDVLGYQRQKGISDFRTTHSFSDFSERTVIFLCLPSVQVVQDVLFGAHGLAHNLPRGAVVIDTSTCEYGATLEIAARLAECGIDFVDAPVSGMQARAEAGTLTMMCGGNAALISRLQPFFAPMASTGLHMGSVGSGQLAKLINQLLFDINMAALAEILPMSAALGLDPGQIGAVVNSGTGRSYASEFFIPNILNGVFDRGYPLAAAYKDLVSGAQISAANGFPLPVLAAATATYQQALRMGHGDKDKGAMILVYEALLGHAFRSTTDKEDQHG